MTTVIEARARELVAKLKGMAIHESHYQDLANALQSQDEVRAAHELTIEAARSNYASDDIEIDDLPMVAETADGGVWVSAWVWVPLEQDDGSAA